MPLTPKQKKRVLMKEVNKTLKGMRQLDKSTAKVVLSSLKRTKSEIALTMKEIERFEFGYLKAWTSEINEKISFFETRAKGSIGDAQGSAWEAGENLSDDIMKVTQITHGIPKLSTELLIANTTMSADLITDMATEMKRDISRSLQRSVLVGENQFQAARKLDKIIGVSKKKGYMNRSDKITRTEIGRTFSVARQAKDEQVAEIVPEMKKQWLTSEDERVRPAPDAHPSMLRWNHRKAHGQIKKVDEPFRVAGENLMFPRDMAGSPQNTINCRCQSVPYMEEWEE